MCKGSCQHVNPAASLLNDKVYGIPCIFVIGWRGEPGRHDEPQHIFQGEVTLPLLEVLDIDSYVVDASTTEADLSFAMEGFRKKLSAGKSVAFVVRRDALQYEKAVKYSNEYSMCREEVIRHIAAVSGEDPVVSTTGKASRELFELREASGLGHRYDFLTVGSMGHSSSIALGVALHKPEARIWCIDGDGAALMHMGAMAVIGSIQPGNLVHIVINNGAHETVGGMPTAAGAVSLTDVARACGYSHAVSASTYEELDQALEEAGSRSSLSFIEAKCGLGSRSDLGRPTTSAIHNKNAFMEYLYTL